MSKKSILNLTSVKKRDTMMAFNQSSSSTNPSAGRVTITAGDGADGYTGILWCPTARDNTQTNAGLPGNVFTPATRTATNCFMRGLKESIEVQTSTGLPWQWRRIVFCAKDPQYFSPAVAPYLETSNGYARLLYKNTGGSANDQLLKNNLRTIVFKGSINSDWSDILNAPIDTARIDLKSDVTTIISSGNSNGKLRKFDRWYPMNKSLVYDDDESGGGESPSVYSVQDKRGMGDLYIWDIFVSGIGGTSSDQITFDPAATLYWHER